MLPEECGIGGEIKSVQSDKDRYPNWTKKSFIGMAWHGMLLKRWFSCLSKKEKEHQDSLSLSISFSLMCVQRVRVAFAGSKPWKEEKKNNKGRYGCFLWLMFYLCLSSFSTLEVWKVDQQLSRCMSFFIASFWTKPRSIGTTKLCHVNI